MCLNPLQYCQYCERIPLTDKDHWHLCSSLHSSPSSLFQVPLEFSQLFSSLIPQPRSPRFDQSWVSFLLIVLPPLLSLLFFLLDKVISPNTLKRIFFFSRKISIFLFLDPGLFKTTYNFTYVQSDCFKFLQ